MQCLLCTNDYLFPWNTIAHKQAWQGKKRQAHGYHLPPSVQGEWLTINDQKNNILASLCLASYLAANWLQKLKMKHCLLRKLFLFWCMWGIWVWFIYNKMKLPFCSEDISLCPIYLTLLCDVEISHYGSWTWWQG